MEFKGLTSASHMSLQEAGYGSEEGQLGSEISGAVSGVTTPGASRLQASQSQERSTTMQRLQPVPIEVAELKSTERGGAGFGSTGVQAVTVKELNEPMFNSAAGPELDQGVLSMYIFLWIMFLPRVAPFFIFLLEVPHLGVPGQALPVTRQVLGVLALPLYLPVLHLTCRYPLSRDRS